MGVACAMAAAAAAQLFGGTPAQIEYAAEMGLEHHLGLTCDPVCGLVQIPCIERNAYAAARAMDANSYAMLTDGAHQVSFDKVVEVMKKTGHDLPSYIKKREKEGWPKITNGCGHVTYPLTDTTQRIQQTGTSIFQYVENILESAVASIVRVGHMSTTFSRQ